MSSDNERAAKVVEFLKAMASNPDQRIELVAQQHQVARATAYSWLKTFVQDYVLTDKDPDFPHRLLIAYNQHLPQGSDKLNDTDVEQLQHLVDEYYSRNLPPESGVNESINRGEPQNRTMSYNNPSDFTRQDTTTDEGYLRSILEDAKYVNPTHINRFIDDYSKHSDIYQRDPMALLERMKWMFGPQAGTQMFNIFQRGRGKFVYGADQQSNQGVDPMTLMLMSQMTGGNINPMMLQGMNPQGGNNMMTSMLISQMNQQAMQNKMRQDQQAMMEQMMNMMMMKFANSAVDERKPMLEGMGGMGMGMPGMGYQIQEYPDETGRIKYRAYVPNYPGMMQQQQDPVLHTMLAKTMEANTAMMLKMADSGKEPQSLLQTLIPFFKTQGDPSAQLTTLINTMNAISPGFLDPNRNRGGTLEEAKLKFDTDLAKMAQQIELAKMQHTWEVDKIDRQSSNDNAKAWINTFTTLGEKVVTDIAPAFVKGLGGGGLLGKGAETPQPNQLQQQMQMQQMRQQQMMARQQEEERQRQVQQSQMQQYNMQQQQQQQPDPGVVYLINSLQEQVNKKDQDIKMLVEQMQQMQSQSQQARNQTFSVDERKILKMPTGQLQSVLKEIEMQNNAEGRLKSVIEAEIHNRQISGSDNLPHEAQQDLPQEPVKEQQFETGEAEPQAQINEAQPKEESENGEQNSDSN